MLNVRDWLPVIRILTFFHIHFNYFKDSLTTRRLIHKKGWKYLYKKSKSLLFVKNNEMYLLKMAFQII